MGENEGAEALDKARADQTEEAVTWATNILAGYLGLRLGHPDLAVFLAAAASHVGQAAGDLHQSLASRMRDAFTSRKARRVAQGLLAIKQGTEDQGVPFGGERLADLLFEAAQK